MNPASVRDVKNFMQRYGLAPLKKLGQNFLVDPNILYKIAFSSAADDKSNVFEIGTGLGALTRELAAVYKKVVSIELDNGLYNSYGDIMDGLANTTLIQGDALKTDIQCICNTYFGGSAFNVCGNLPYYITSKLLLHILESCAPVASVTVMVQKEVAERLASSPGDTGYGALTASVRYYGRPELLFHVSKNCFYPSPDVDSAIIRLDRGNAPVFSVGRKEYTRIVRTAFSMQRKTLFNNLKTIMDADSVTDILSSLGIPPAARAQEISPEQYAGIAHLAKDMK